MKTHKELMIGFRSMQEIISAVKVGKNKHTVGKPEYLLNFLRHSISSTDEAHRGRNVTVNI